MGTCAGEGTFVDVFLPSVGRFNPRKHVYNGVSEVLVATKQLPFTGVESLMPDIYEEINVAPLQLSKICVVNKALETSLPS